MKTDQPTPKGFSSSRGGAGVWRWFSALVFLTCCLAVAALETPGHATLSSVELTPNPIYALKGRPDLAGAASITPGYGGAYYFYAAVRAPEAQSDLASIPAGASARMSQHNPDVPRGDFHSLVELAVSSADGADYVEVGWTVDPLVNRGDRRNPHLFVFHWVDGEPTCYNGCGWVQVSKSRVPGMRLDITEVPQDYAIEFRDGNWWVRYQREWIGYFPGSLWDNSFTAASGVDWFGEVATSRPRPCADMGWLDFGSSNGPYVARMMSLTWILPQQLGEVDAPLATRTIVTDPTAYDLGSATAGLVEYGGPGFC